MSQDESTIQQPSNLYDDIIGSTPTPKPKRYSIGDLQDAAREAGWPEQEILKTSAIAWHEGAQGDPRANRRASAAENARLTGSATASGEDSVGPWQINWAAHGSRLQKQGIKREDLFDRVTSARVALDLYNDDRAHGRSGYSPWKLANTKFHQQYLPLAQKAYQRRSSGSVYDDIISGDTSNGNSYDDIVSETKPSTVQPTSLTPRQQAQQTISGVVLPQTPVQSSLAPVDRYTTRLSPEEEGQFHQWKLQYAPSDSGADYDLRGAFKAGQKPDSKTGHWPDTFKKPNHPTFSKESRYAVGDDARRAGSWNGDQYIPPAQPESAISETAVNEARRHAYVNRELGSGTWEGRANQTEGWTPEQKEMMDASLIQKARDRQSERESARRAAALQRQAQTRRRAQAQAAIAKTASVSNINAGDESNNPSFDVGDKRYYFNTPAEMQQALAKRGVKTEVPELPRVGQVAPVSEIAARPSPSPTSEIIRRAASAPPPQQSGFGEVHMAEARDAEREQLAVRRAGIIQTEQARQGPGLAPEQERIATALKDAGFDVPRTRPSVQPKLTEQQIAELHKTMPLSNAEKQALREGKPIGPMGPAFDPAAHVARVRELLTKNIQRQVAEEMTPTTPEGRGTAGFISPGKPGHAVPVSEDSPEVQAETAKRVGQMMADPNIVNMPLRAFKEKTLTNWWNEFKRGSLTDQAIEIARVAPFLGQGVQIGEAARIYSLAQKKQRGEASESEQREIARFQVEAGRQGSSEFQIASIIAQLPAFALELAGTGGLYTGGKKLAQKGITRAAESAVARKVEGVVLKGIERQAVRNVVQDAITIGGKTARSLVGSAIQTPVARGGSIVAGTLQRMTPTFQFEDGKLTGAVTKEGKSLPTALARSLVSEYIEVASEQAGGIFSAMGEATSAKSLKKGFELLTKMPEGTPDTVINILKRGRFHGTAGEMFEERLADVGHYLNGDQDSPFAPAGQLGIEAVAFSIPDLAFRLIPGASRALRMARHGIDGQSQKYHQQIVDAMRETREAWSRGTNQSGVPFNALEQRIVQHSWDALVNDYEAARWNPKFERPDFWLEQGLPPGAPSPVERAAPVVTEAPEEITSPTADTPRVPERPETLTAQIEALQEGRGSRKAVIIPENTDLPAIPEGLEAHVADDGSTFIYDPKKTSPETIDKAVETNTTHKLIGKPNAETPKATLAAATYDLAGLELDAGYLEPGNEKAYMDEMRAQHGPNVTFSIGGKPVEDKVLSDRLSETPAQPVIAPEVSAKPETASTAERPLVETATTSASTVSPASEGNSATYYRERLANPELLDGAIYLNSPEGNLFAVPVGGVRKLGASSVLYSKAEGTRLLDQIKGEPGFTNARLRAVNGSDKFSLEWGGPSPGYRSETNTAEDIGRAYGYSEQAIADFVARKHEGATQPQKASTASPASEITTREVPKPFDTSGEKLYIAVDSSGTDIKDGQGRTVIGATPEQAIATAKEWGPPVTALPQAVEQPAQPKSVAQAASPASEISILEGESRFQTFNDVNRHLNKLSGNEMSAYYQARRNDPQSQAAQSEYFNAPAREDSLAKRQQAETQFANRYFAQRVPPQRETTASPPTSVSPEGAQDETTQISDKGIRPSSPSVETGIPGVGDAAPKLNPKQRGLKPLPPQKSLKGEPKDAETSSVTSVDTNIPSKVVKVSTGSKTTPAKGAASAAPPLVKPWADARVGDIVEHEGQYVEVAGLPMKQGKAEKVAERSGGQVVPVGSKFAVVKETEYEKPVDSSAGVRGDTAVPAPGAVKQGGVDEIKPSLIDEVSVLIDDKGKLTRGGDYVTSLMEGRSDAEVQALHDWAEAHESPAVRRWTGGNASAELRRREQAKEEKPDHDFSSTQVQITGDAAKLMRAAQAKIDPADVDEEAGGIEEDLHSTLKYGVHSNSPKEVQRVLEGEGPITAKFGKVEIFKAGEGHDYDVVIVAIDSPDLHRLNKAVAEGVEVTDTFPTYKAHATLAYVRAGTGKKYVGMDVGLEGKELTFDHVRFSSKDRTVTDIPLGGEEDAETVRGDQGIISGKRKTAGRGEKTGEHDVHKEGEGRKPVKQGKEPASRQEEATVETAPDREGEVTEDVRRQPVKREPERDTGETSQEAPAKEAPTEKETQVGGVSGEKDLADAFDDIFEVPAGTTAEQPAGKPTKPAAEGAARPLTTPPSSISEKTLSLGEFSDRVKTVSSKTSVADLQSLVEQGQRIRETVKTNTVLNSTLGLLEKMLKKKGGKVADRKPETATEKPNEIEATTPKAQQKAPDQSVVTGTAKLKPLSERPGVDGRQYFRDKKGNLYVSLNGAEPELYQQSIGAPAAPVEPKEVAKPSQQASEPVKPKSKIGGATVRKAKPVVVETRRPGSATVPKAEKTIAPKPTYTRTTPSPGTPERAASEQARKDFDKKTEELSQQEADFKAKAQNSKNYSKVQEQWKKKAEKADDQLQQVYKEYEAQRKQWRAENLEDTIVDGDEANGMSALAILNDDSKGLYDKVKKLGIAEAKRQGANDEEAESAAISASSMIMSYPGTNRAMVTQIETELRVSQQKKRISDAHATIDALPDLAGKSDYYRKLEQTYGVPEDIERIVKEAKQADAAARTLKERAAKNIENDRKAMIEKLGPANGYFVRVNEQSYGEPFLPVNGTAVTIKGAENTPLFVHRRVGDPNEFSVSEATTGFSIGQGKTEQGAKRAAAKTIEEKGPEKFQAAIAAAVEKQGASPWGAETEKGEALYARQIGRPAYTPPYTLTALKDEKLANRRGREVKLVTIKQILKQPETKQIERDVILEVLDTPEFQGKESVPFDDFEAEVQQALMPLRVINSSSYSDYGHDNVGVNTTRSDTHIYNTDLEHGHTGHFSSVFDERRKFIYEVKEVVNPRNNKTVYVTVPQGVELTEENIATSVGTATGSRKRAEAWIEMYNSGPGNINKGMFGHTRVWQDNSPIAGSVPDSPYAHRQEQRGDSYVAEIQSDTFQQHAAEEMVLESYLNKFLNSKRRAKTDRPDSLMEKVADLHNMQAAVKRDSSFDRGLYQGASEKLANANQRIEAHETDAKIGQSLLDSGIADEADKAFEKERADAAAVPDFSGPYSYLSHDRITGLLQAAYKNNPDLNAKVEAFRYSGSGGEVTARILLSDAALRAKIGESAEPLSDPIKHAIRRLTEQAEQAKEDRDAALSITESPGYRKFFDDVKLERSIRKQLLQALPIQDKQFIAHRKNYTTRMLREEIRRQAAEGQKRLLIPTPRTLALIEGYISDEERMPYTIVENNSRDDDLHPGDKIKVGEIEYTVIDDEDGITVAKSDEVFTIDEYEEQKYQTKESMDEARAGLKQFEGKRLNVDGASEITAALKEARIYGLDYDPETYFDVNDNGKYTFRFSAIESDAEDKAGESAQESVSDRFQDYESVKELRQGVYVAVEKGTDTEKFNQPSEYSDSDAGLASFKIDDMSETEQTVLRKYEELNALFKKERSDAELVDDEKGNQWLATKLTPEDAGPVAIFSREQSQLFGDASEPAQFRVAGNRLYLENTSAADLVAEAMGEEPGAIKGMFVDPESYPTLRSGLRRLASVNQPQAARLLKAVQDAYQEHGSVRMATPERMAHELPHGMSFESAQGFLRARYPADRIEHLESQPQWDTISERLGRMNYPTTGAVANEEAYAMLMEGKYVALGLTEDEGLDWLTQWFITQRDVGGNISSTTFTEATEYGHRAREAAFTYEGRSETRQQSLEGFPDTGAERSPAVSEEDVGGEEPEFARAREGLTNGLERQDIAARADRSTEGQRRAERPDRGVQQGQRKGLSGQESETGRKAGTRADSGLLHVQSSSVDAGTDIGSRGATEDDLRNRVSATEDGGRSRGAHGALSRGSGDTAGEGGDAPEQRTLADIEPRVAPEFKAWLSDLLDNDKEEISAAMSDDSLRRSYLDDYLNGQHSINVRSDGLIEFYRLDGNARDIIGDNPVIVYHHTSDAILPKIRKDGLKRTDSAHNAYQNSKAGVYVTTEVSGPAVAGYQQSATSNLGGNEIILGIKTDLDSLEPDPDDADIQSGATQYVLPYVSPQDIVEITRGSKTEPFSQPKAAKRQMYSRELPDYSDEPRTRTLLQSLAGGNQGVPWDRFLEMAEMREAEGRSLVKSLLSEGLVAYMPANRKYKTAAYVYPTRKLKDDLAAFYGAEAPEELAAKTVDEVRELARQYNLRKQGIHEPEIDDRTAGLMFARELEDPEWEEIRQGGRDIGEQVEGGFPTGVKNRITDEERANLGQDPIEIEARKIIPMFDSVKQDFDPNKSYALAAEIEANPRNLSAEETAQMIMYKAWLKNQYAEALKDLRQAREGESGEGAARIRLATLDEQMLTYQHMGRLSGYEWGLTGRLRQEMMLADYSLAEIKARAGALMGIEKGETLPADLEQRLADLTAERDAAIEALRVYDEKKSLEAAEQRLKDLQEQERREERNRRARQSQKWRENQDKEKTRVKVVTKILNREALDDEFDQMSRELDAMLTSDFGLNPFLEPRLLSQLKKMATNRVKAGADTVEDWILPVWERIKGKRLVLDAGATERDLRDALSGYGKTIQMSKEEIDIKLRELRALARDVSALEDIEAGQRPARSGLQRDKQTQRLRESKKRINAALREYNIEVEHSERSPEELQQSALDSMKSRLRNRIEDLKTYIAGGERAQKRPPVQPDPEAQILMAERDRLQKVLDDIEGPSKRTDDEKIALATAAVERSIADYERRIAEGDVLTHRKAVEPWSRELGRLKKRQGELKAQVAEDRKNHLTTKAEAAERILRGLKSSIDRIERRVAAGDLSVAPKAAPTVSTPEIEAAKVQRKALQSILAKMRTAAKPKKTDAEKYASRLVALGRRLDKREIELNAMLRSGNYAKKPKSIPARDTYIEAKRADIKRVEDKIDLEMAKIKRADRNAAEKIAFDWLVPARRAVGLSSTFVLGKLSVAAYARIFLSMGEEVYGGVLSHLPILKRVAERAASEGRFSFQAEINHIVKAFSKSMTQQVGQAIKTGKLDIDVTYGNKRYEELPGSEIKIAGHKVMDSKWLEFIGHVHLALKTPAKLAAFERYMQKNLEWFARHGYDPTDRAIVQMAGARAIVDANRAIFQQENLLSDWFSETTRSFRRKGFAGKGVAMTLRLLFFVTRVAPNFIIETANYTPMGAVAATVKLVHGAHKYGLGPPRLPPVIPPGGSFEGFDPEQGGMPRDLADSIMRGYKKSGFGFAFLVMALFSALGLFGMDRLIKFGGYYKRGEKRKDDDVQANGIRVMGWDLPRWATHIPILEAMQATVNAVQEYHDEREKGEGVVTSTVGAGVGTLRGFAEEIPFYEEPVRAITAIEQGWQGWTRYSVGLFRSMTLPPDLQRQARIWDSAEPTTKLQKLAQATGFKRIIATKRKPEGNVFERAAQEYELGIPGLRKNVPVNTDGSRIELKEQFTNQVRQLKVMVGEARYQKLTLGDPNVTDPEERERQRIQTWSNLSEAQRNTWTKTMGQITEAEEKGQIKPADPADIAKDAQETPLQLKFAGRDIKDAMTMYERLSPSDRAEVREMLIDKGPSIEKLFRTEQADARRKFKALTGEEPRIKERNRPSPKWMQILTNPGQPSSVAPQ